MALARWLGYAAAALAVVLVALVLLVPVAVDLPWARAELQRIVSQAAGGKVTWESFSLQLQRPRGMLSGLRVEIGGLRASAGELAVGLSHRALFQGRIEITELYLRGLDFHAAPVKEKDDKGEPADPAVIVKALRRFAPDAELRIESATVELPAIHLRGLNARAMTGEAGVELELRGASDLWRDLHAQASLRYADLALNLKGEIKGIAVARVLERRREPVPAVKSATGEIDLRIERVAMRLDDRKSLDFELIAIPRGLAVESEYFPAALKGTGGAARIGPQDIRFERLAVAMLDSAAKVSGSLRYQGPRVDARVDDGQLGPELAQWIAAQAKNPQFQPSTPLRFAARRIAWQPGQPLEAAATFDIERGPSTSLDLVWSPQALQVKRFTIKDARSDAVLSLLMHGQVLDGGFEGTLHGNSIAALFKDAEPHPALIAGKLALHIDRAEPRRSRASGRIRAENLDFAWILKQPLRVARADLAVEGETLTIGEMAFSWAEQAATLRGAVRFGAQGPEVDARFEAPGIDVDKLLPVKTGEETETKQKKTQSALWPLPVTGRVAVQAGFVRYDGYEAKPLRGSVRLEPRRAQVEVDEGTLCGLSLPLTFEITPERMRGELAVFANDQPLDAMLRCLGKGEGGTELKGLGDLRADVSTQGANPGELLRNLAGTVNAEARNGEVGQMELLGRILSMRNFDDIGGMVQSHRDARGLRYRSFTLRGHLKGGQFLVDESVFDSDAVRLVSTGAIGIAEPDTQLTVLVGILGQVDRVVAAIPLIGRVLGGTLLALPVSVRGDIRDPLVVPLGPHAVSDRLIGILGRTIKTPIELVAPPKPAN